MPEVEVLRIEGDTEPAVKAFERLRDGLGRFVAAANAQSGVLKAVEGDIYAFADAYDVLPSKGDAFRASQQRASAAAKEAADQLRREADAAGVAAVALEGNAAATIRCSTATLRLADATDAAGRGSGRAGGRLLQFGRILDDSRQAQYGFTNFLNAVGNNLVEISPKLGIAAIALGIVASQWERIGKLAERYDLKGPYDELNGILQKVGESFGFVAGEAEKAREAGKAAAADLAKIADPAQAQRAKAVTEVIGRFGGGDAARGLVETEARRQGKDAAKAVTQLDAAAKGDEAALGNVQALLRPASGRAALFGQEIAGEIERAALADGAAKIEEGHQADQAAAAESNAALDARALKLAESLAAGGIGTQRLGGETPKVGDVAKELKRVTGEEPSAELAEAVRAKINDVIAGQAKDLALEEGISPEDAVGRLYKEREDAFGADLAKANEARSQRDIAAAEEKDPILRQLAAVAARTGYQQGGAEGARQAALSVLRERGGINALSADPLAKDLAAQEERNAFAEFLKGEPVRASRIEASDQYLQSIQAGVGGANDPNERTARETARTSQLLAEILREQRDGEGGKF